MQRVNAIPADKKIIGLQQVSQSLRSKSLVQLQSMLSLSIPEKDRESTFVQLIASFESPSNASVATVAETLLDICRVAWAFGLRNTAILCFEKAEQFKALNPIIRAKSDLCKV
jgi:hypothetical protein